MAHRTQARQTRADETRAETSERKTDAHDNWPETWQRPSRLDAPEPREGMRQKWVSKQLLGQEDRQNMAKRFREGWRPRPLETIPQSFMPGMDFRDAESGYLEVQGLILCEMPERLVAQRDAAYRTATRNNEAFIDQDLDRAESPDNPIHRNRSTKVTTGRRPVEPQDD